MLAYSLKLYWNLEMLWYKLFTKQVKTYRSCVFVIWMGWYELEQIFEDLISNIKYGKIIGSLL